MKYLILIGIALFASNVQAGQRVTRDLGNGIRIVTDLETNQTWIIVTTEDGVVIENELEN